MAMSQQPCGRCAASAAAARCAWVLRDYIILGLASSAEGPSLAGPQKLHGCTTCLGALYACMTVEAGSITLAIHHHQSQLEGCLCRA